MAMYDCMIGCYAFIVEQASISCHDISQHCFTAPEDNEVFYHMIHNDKLMYKISMSHKERKHNYVKFNVFHLAVIRKRSFRKDRNNTNNDTGHFK